MLLMLCESLCSVVVEAEYQQLVVTLYQGCGSSMSIYRVSGVAVSEHGK